MIELFPSQMFTKILNMPLTLIKYFFSMLEITQLEIIKQLEHSVKRLEHSVKRLESSMDSLNTEI